MRAILFFLTIILYSSPSLSSDQKYQAVFGAPFTISKPMPIKDAISHLNKFKDKEILISGTVSKVCEKKGCWMVLKDEKNSIRVTFNNYSFFVPSDIVGKSVQAQGKLHEELMSISEARHFAKDAGQSDSKVNAIKQKVKEYRFVATAVKIGP